MQVIKIHEIDKGIAHRIGDCIFINKKLKDYPKLYNAILQHEMEHSSGFNLHDIKLDIINSHLKGLKLEYYKFILSNPSTLVEFLPIYKEKDCYIINPTLLGLYSLLLIILGGILWLIY